MEIKKISKWDAAPESIKNLLNVVSGVCDGMIYRSISPSEADESEDLIKDAISKVLDDYNKLETKHQLDCGLISDYAEENARLKQKNEKASNNIRDLRWALDENDVATYLNPVTVSWGVANVALQKKTEHFNTQLDNLRERLREAEKSKEKWIARYHDMSDICSRDEDDSEMLQAILRKDGYTIEYEGDIDDETIRCQDPINICKETTQDEVMYQYGRWTLTRPLRFSEAKANADAAILRKQCDRHINLLDKLRWALEDKGILVEWSEAALKWNIQSRIDRQEIEDKDKLIEELRQKIEDLEIKTSYYVAHITSLKREIEKLEKRNKSLRRTVKILDGEGYF